MRLPGAQGESTPASDFAGFYSRHSRALLRYFARRVFDPEVALDLTAETFAQAFISRTRFRGETEEEGAGWLFGIARNLLSHYVRDGIAERRAIERLGIEVPAMTPDGIARIGELAELAELRAAAANGLAELTEAQREALRLRIIEERPYDEVARAMNVSEPTARARVARGLRALGEAMTKEDPR
jgi:RNA polymerase sigma factor (sigma-70 family)